MQFVSDLFSLFQRFLNKLFLSSFSDYIFLVVKHVTDKTLEFLDIFSFIYYFNVPDSRRK